MRANEMLNQGSVLRINPLIDGFMTDDGNTGVVTFEAPGNDFRSPAVFDFSNDPPTQVRVGLKSPNTAMSGLSAL